MARYAECDNCGERDDWADNKGPLLENGAVIEIRGDNGSREPIISFELCFKCKEDLLGKFPKLKALLDKAREEGKI